MDFGTVFGHKIHENSMKNRIRKTYLFLMSIFQRFFAILARFGEPRIVENSKHWPWGPPKNDQKASKNNLKPQKNNKKQQKATKNNKNNKNTPLGNPGEALIFYLGIMRENSEFMFMNSAFL